MNRFYPEIQVVLDDGAYMPERAHATDAGFDLFTPTDLEVPPRGSCEVDTGVHFAIPEGLDGHVRPKSGLNFKRDILSFGTVDSGYTGPVKVKLYNMGDEPQRFKRGDSVSQIVFEAIALPVLEPADSLDETERGDGGFGSTGSRPRGERL